MPLMPLPMDTSQPLHVRLPLMNPRTALTMMPMVRTAVTLSPDSARPMIITYGISSIQLTAPASGDALTEAPRITYNIVTTRAAGPTMRRFTLNLSAIEQPWDLVAAMVVSDMNERLSPKNDPPTMMPVMNAVLDARSAPNEISWAMPAARGTRATMVPTLVPMDMDMKHDARNNPA